MNLPVAVLVHQPEIRKVIRAPVILGPHMVHVDLFAIVQSLVATGTETVLPPGELPRATSRGLHSVPPLAPVVLKGRVIGGMRGGDKPMADDLGPGELPEGPMPLLILKDPAVLSTTDPTPILLGPPLAGFSRVPPLHVALSAFIHEAIQGREHFLGHPDTEIVAPASDDGIHLVHQCHGG